MKKKIFAFIIIAGMLLAAACGQKEQKGAQEYLAAAQHQLALSKQYRVTIDMHGTLRTSTLQASGDEVTTERMITTTGHLKKTHNHDKAHTQGYVSFQIGKEKPKIDQIERYIDRAQGLIYDRESKTQEWYIAKASYNTCRIEGTGFDLQEMLGDIKENVVMEERGNKVVLTGKKPASGLVTQVTMDKATGSITKIFCTIDLPDSKISGISYQYGTIEADFDIGDLNEITIPDEARNGTYMHDEKGGGNNGVSG